MDRDYHIITQFDSWTVSEEQFIYRITGHWLDGEGAPDVAVIEDLPHGLNYTRTVKRVLRLQGRIAQAMYEVPGGGIEDIVFLAPNAWRAHYDLKNGTGAAIVVPTAATLGYHPPDLTSRAKGNGGRTVATKVATDYCAAFLIARFAVDMEKEHGTYDVVGTSRYHTDVVRKKERETE